MYVETPFSTNQIRDYSNHNLQVAKKFQVWWFFENCFGTVKAIKKIFGRKISGQIRRLLKKKSRKKIENWLSYKLFPVANKHGFF